MATRYKTTSKKNSTGSGRTYSTKYISGGVKTTKTNRTGNPKSKSHVTQSFSFNSKTGKRSMTRTTYDFAGYRTRTKTGLGSSKKPRTGGSTYKSKSHSSSSTPTYKSRTSSTSSTKTSRTPFKKISHTYRYKKTKGIGFGWLLGKNKKEKSFPRGYGYFPDFNDDKPLTFWGVIGGIFMMILYPLVYPLMIIGLILGICGVVLFLYVVYKGIEVLGYLCFIPLGIVTYYGLKWLFRKKTPET